MCARAALVLTFAIAVDAGVLVSPAYANDPCSILFTTATCTGDQSSGKAIDTGSGITSLFLQSLTVPIGPPNGVSFKSEGADGGNNGSGADATNLSVTADGTVVIHATGSASGIYVSSKGGDSFDVGGGHGGLAGDVTVQSGATITTGGVDAYGILARSIGGNGRPNNQDNGGLGTVGGNVTVSSSGAITTTNDGATGIFAYSSSGHTTNSSTFGITVGTVTVTNTGSIETSGTTSYFLPSLAPLLAPLSYAHGIVAVNIAGSGSDGKNENRLGSASGGNAGNGGDATAVTVTTSGSIVTHGDGSYGIYAQSQGGFGGTGGAAGERGSTDAGGGNGAAGGVGGPVTVNASGTVSTGGDNAIGIFANSVGGYGGNGGSATGGTAVGRDGGTGGTGGDVTVTLNGPLTLSTHGASSYGIYALSLGGFGGTGGDASDSLTIDGTSGNGGIGGLGGTVTVQDSGSATRNITTDGANAYGILAKSQGGAGGNGADALGSSNANARNGGAAGNGGVVNIDTSANVTTGGTGAFGIYAWSQGGNSGNGGHAFSLFNASAGNSHAAGAADAVTLTSTGIVATHGAGAAGLVALSAGGNGGNGNSGDAAGSTGGYGGAGGDGAAVTVNANGSVTTTSDLAVGVLAHSLGGTGGNGDDAGGVSGSGGTGGGGGSGKLVTVNVNGSVATSGALSYGVFATSEGGTGGHGGGGAGVVANGGTGGKGGDGGDIIVNTGVNSDINTEGLGASGIYAKSIGSAGGDGANAGAAYASPGAGGQGGSSGHVTITSNGTIVTQGLGAFGVQAESTGGGGGTAASGNGVVAIGASGGAAANGGLIDVTNNGSVTTGGTFAHGIVAASIGGGGGAGSQTGGVVALGGAGNSSGDGNIVNVTNNGSILTTGLGAYGIFAESVGGGGGNGGGSSGFVTIGGDGGGGGKGEKVTVINGVNGTITTTGIGSHGIFAQSVGGGGGDGGSASSYAGPSVASVAIGGDGGTAGDGGDLLVKNYGAVTVSGFRSSAIFAQSTGGGGGNGGDSSDVGVTVVDYTIGGKGGAAGKGGDVEVDNYGTITSHSDLASAIFAQSTGGGGGSGGAAYGFSGNLVNATVAIGGDGGAAGIGGTVTITQSGAITTTGIMANGITAFSIGGGGGSGGSSMARSISASPKGSVALALSMGGKGGAAGDGGVVGVTNTGWIMTAGAMSYGVFAQSVGGGGGNGGDATASAQVVVAKDAAAIAIGIGGSGGAGGAGNTVTVTNNGRIVTLGADSHAIVAQSIGGGGGIGGAGRASSNPDVAGELLSFLATNSDDPDPTKPPPEQDKPNKNDKVNSEQKKDKEKDDKKISVSVGVGGSGGAAGIGGGVNVTNIGSIDTYGYAAYGIFAQSVGGGGGAAGGGGANSEGDVSVGVGLGGASGGAGKGGDVLVTNTGAIATRGDDAFGIFAQSVGGGGGIAATGDGSAGTDPKNVAISVGGAAGSAGDGGAVIVNQTGDVTTIGDRAMAIFAQSIGGGGGVAGTGQGEDGASIVVGGRGGSGGVGGTVNVTMTGNIETYGAGAHGIFAQSIGGGGGIGGDASGNNPSLQSHAMTVGVGVGGAGGDAGNGGEVIITSTGTIVTHGYRTYGIFAQSVGGGGGTGGSGNASLGTIPFAGSNGGAGTGNKITVEQSGSVVATGLDSHAIFAQSVGGNGGDNITINLHSGTIAGGGGTGAGIFLDGGKNNAITIDAGVTVSALSGLAIKGTDGVDQNNVARVIGNTMIANAGTIFGDVDLGAGVGGLNNQATGIFTTGQAVNLGSGTMTSAGRIDLGGINNIVTTALTGSFVQGQTGVLAVDAVFGGKSDVLAATGTANVRGKIEPHLTSLLPNAPTTIVTAAGGFTGTNDVTPINSPSVTYSTQIVGNALQLNVQSAQFVSPAFAPFFSPNETSVANQLQGIWNAGGTTGIGPAFAYFASLTDPVLYAQALDRLHPAPLASQNSSATLTGLNFADSMMSCHNPAGPFAPLYETACDWAKVTGNIADKGSSSSSSGYRDRAARIQVGRQTQVAPDWFLEFAAGYEAARTTVGNFSTTQADRYDFGVALKRQIGPWLFATAVDGGYAALDTTRNISLPGVQSAKSRPDIWRLDWRLRAAYLYDFGGGAYLKPAVDLDMIYTAMPGFNETGAGALNLQVASMDHLMFAASPTLELGRTLLWKNGQAMRPYVQAGAMFLTGNAWTLNATFEGAPPGVAPFSSTNGIPNTVAKVSTGLDLFNMAGINGLDLRLEYGARFAHAYREQTGSLKLVKRF
jgi:hypothetical protein